MRTSWRERRKLDPPSQRSRFIVTPKALPRNFGSWIAHRKRLDIVAQCIKKADANYHATRADYDACLANITPYWEEARRDFIAAETKFRQAVTSEELKSIEQEVTAK